MAARAVAVTPEDTPLVSVVMTLHKDTRFFQEAVDSVLRQSLKSFELIIVDDGAGHHDLFRQVAASDPRIRTIHLPANVGTAAAANAGISAARAAIIARLDADDVARPDRLLRVCEEFSKDPALGLLGHAVTVIDERGQAIGSPSMPETDLEIRWTILFHNPFYHSASAYRRTCFDLAGGYRPEELISQDHYLWFEMLPHCRARNMKDQLCCYRINSQGLTQTNLHGSRNRTHRIREALWGKLGLAYDLYDDALAANITKFVANYSVDPADRFDAYRKILTVQAAFLRHQTLRSCEDVSAAWKLATSTSRRMAAEPPALLRHRLVVRALCVRLLTTAAWLRLRGVDREGVGKP